MTLDEYPAVLVKPSWLHDHLHDPSLRLVEVDVSPKVYNEGHVEGAVLWNIYQDLKDADYRLVDKAAIQRVFERSGIAPDSTVVFYGYAPALGFWLTKLYGHADARILDCSKEAWRREDRPWTTDVSTPAVTHYPLPHEDEHIRVQRLEVARRIGDPGSTIVDVRTAPEFRGECFWPSGGQEEGGRAGHIPSAIHVPLDGLYDERGSFRSRPDLQQRFASVDLPASTKLITYCTIGGRACTAWFVLTHLLGRKHVRVYDGSWAAWGRMPSAPVE